jgi:transcriptional repressor of cell division inhibition gene dicB
MPNYTHCQLGQTQKKQTFPCVDFLTPGYAKIYLYAMTKREAILHFGSQAALARALGIGRASVNQWPEIPLPRQFQIQVITDGHLLADGQARPIVADRVAQDQAA